MKLTNKLRTGILATTLTGLIGCAEFEEMEEAYLEQIIFQGGAAKLRERGEYEKAQAMENIGLIRGNIAAARAGRSEVNVNVDTNTNENRRRQQLPDNVILSSNGNYSPAQGYTWINPKDNKDLRVRKEQRTNYSNREVPSFFIANYWKDLNENGVPEVKEIVGYMGGNKRDFNQGENVSFWLQNFDRDTRLPIEFKIYNPKGKEIYSNTFMGEKKGMCQTLPDFGGFSPDYFEDKGTYLASYSIDGKFKESIQFNIH